MKITAIRSGFLVCAFALGISNTSKSQSTFVRMYNEGNMGFSVREVNGNSYVVAGGTDFYFNWHWFIQSSLATTNIHLFKTDANGVLQWERVISKPGNRMVSRWMEPTDDGGFILAGSTNRDLIWPPDSNDIVMVKTDAAGMVSWSKIFDTGKDELGFCVQQTADGGYIISGFHDAMPVSLAFNTYILLIKTDALGNVQWEKKYQFAIRDFNTKEPFSYVVKQTANGGYIIAGTNAVAHPADVGILRTDASGNVLWAKTYEHDPTVWRNSVGLDVIESTSGDFVIAGSMDKDSPLHLNYPYFLKIDSLGAVLKQRFYETVPLLNFQSGFSSVQQTPDGGFFFTGMGGYSDFGDQAQLLKTNANLDMIWNRVYTWDGLATVGSMSGRQTSDGGYVFTGKRQMTGTILMKTNGVGLVACKIPHALIEFTPSVSVSSWNPPIITGINTSTPLLSVSSPLIDTTIICPITVPTLPVELSFFNAYKLSEEKVQVEWMTSGEINNDFFIVERSADNVFFEEAGKIRGAGNATTAFNYEFIDEQPLLSSVSYYRLRQIDYDGRSHLSKSVPVTFQPSEFEVVSIFADRNDGSLRIVIKNMVNGQGAYTLTDALGNVIYNENQPLKQGISLIHLDMKNVAQGVYVFSISNELCKKSAKVAY